MRPDITMQIPTERANHFSLNPKLRILRSITNQKPTEREQPDQREQLQKIEGINGERVTHEVKAHLQHRPQATQQPKTVVQLFSDPTKG